jgi:DNA-binding CsgD family transcriptional regulator
MPEAPVGADDWEQLFWAVFEGSTNPVALLDEQRVIVSANVGMCELMGASRSELVGASADDFVAAHELLNVNAEWRAFWDSGAWSNERILVGAGGVRLRFQFAARTGNVGGLPVAVIVCIAVGPEDEPEPPEQLGELTPREREILTLVALGNTSVEIAEHLVISKETVRTHVRNSMAKTGAKTRAQLVALALADRALVGV